VTWTFQLDINSVTVNQDAM